MKSDIIHSIQLQMKPVLNQGQYMKLTKVLVSAFDDVEIIDQNNNLSDVDNHVLLNSFLSAKEIEGCSLNTIQYYRKLLTPMLKHIDKRVDNISTDDLRGYMMEYKSQKGLSKVSVDNIRRVFSSFFTWLENEDYILKNPVKRIHRIKMPRVVRDTLNDENIESIRQCCGNIRDLAIVDLLFSTGIRVGELVNLDIKDINFNERECVVWGKGDSERLVYFDARCKLHLNEYLETRDDDNPALFVSFRRPYTRLGINGVELRLKKIGEKCGIPKLHPHLFRRTMATNAIDKGMPIEQVQKLLGHMQIDTTLMYAMVNQANVKIAHKRYIG